MGCGIISRKAEEHSSHRRNDLIGNKILMRSWVIPPGQIFPVIANVAKVSFPRSKVHKNFQKNRLHFWYFDSENGDALIIMDITGQDSVSTLNLYKPRYGVSQPLFTKDPIPITQFFIDLDNRIRDLGIPVVFKRSVTP